MPIEEHYLKQIKSKLIINHLPNFSSLPPKEQVLRESQSLIGKLSSKDFLICLDSDGEAMSSEEFTRHMSSWSQNKSIAFIIGGSHGISENLKATSNFILSFSKMTFPHQVAKMILLEQIFRAESIISGKEYHK